MVLAASDGSMRNFQGTFGWALSIRRGPTLALCSGPAYGAPMDSFRAEGCGQPSLWVFVDLLCQYHNTEAPKLEFWCDNKSLVDKIAYLSQLSHPSFPNDALSTSWDILQAIQRISKAHPGIKVYHVKEHQDDTGDFDKLPSEAKMNIKADELESAFQNTSTHLHDPTPMIEGTYCHQCINNKTIMSRQRRHLRDVRCQEALQAYMQQKTNMNNNAVKEVD